MKNLFLLLLICLLWDNGAVAQNTDEDFITRYYTDLQELGNAWGKKKRQALLQDMLETYFLDSSYVDRGSQYDPNGQVTAADFLEWVAKDRNKRTYYQELLFRGTPQYHNGVSEHNLHILVKETGRNVGLMEYVEAFYLWYSDYSDKSNIKIKWIEHRGELTAPASDDIPLTLKQLERDMVRIEGGVYLMGNDSTPPNESGNDEGPVHEVMVSDFSLGKYEVTQAQWQAVMGTNPSFNKHCSTCPVEMVSWQDVQLFLRKLNTITGKKYRLPLEAEWEYAAAGGKKSNGYLYAGSNTLHEVAWYSVNAEIITHPVGRKKANELGLYDMSGNVWEFCQDMYSPYATTPANVPQKEDTRFMCIIRGGTWLDNPTEARIRNRDYCNSAVRFFNLGFRLAHP